MYVCMNAKSFFFFTVINFLVYGNISVEFNFPYISFLYIYSFHILSFPYIINEIIKIFILQIFNIFITSFSYNFFDYLFLFFYLRTAWKTFGKKSFIMI